MASKVAMKESGILASKFAQKEKKEFDFVTDRVVGIFVSKFAKKKDEKIRVAIHRHISPSNFGIQ